MCKSMKKVKMWESVEYIRINIFNEFGLSKNMVVLVVVRYF